MSIYYMLASKLHFKYIVTEIYYSERDTVTAYNLDLTFNYIIFVLET